MIKKQSVQPSVAVTLAAKPAGPAGLPPGSSGDGKLPDQQTALSTRPSGISADKKALPYLTVVAASRNDDHGGDPLRRTQIFIESLAAQAEKEKLSIELILVDWNPVEGRPGLGAALRPPKGGAEWFTARVITVPASLHQRFKYGDRLAFFQMIAKNVGVRRARGEFILATNIDILFSQELMAFLARRQLDPRCTYRADRLDIPGEIPRRTTPAEILKGAAKNVIRQHRRLGPVELLPHLERLVAVKTGNLPSKPKRQNLPGGYTISTNGKVASLHSPRKAVPLTHLHTNGCGDFTLLSRDGWHVIRGYPEFEAFSFNIDSMGLIAAHHAGFREVSLLPPCVCYHIEHAVGSGWSPEGESKLFARLNTAGILNPEWSVLAPLADRMTKSGRHLEFNEKHWGLAQHELPETPLGSRVKPTPPSPGGAYAVTALRAEFDMDRLTLWHERANPKAPPSAAPPSAAPPEVESVCQAQVYWPDTNGQMNESASAHCKVRIGLKQQVLFSLPAFCTAYPLRLDPMDRAGVVELFSVAFYDGGKRCQLFDARRQGEREIRISGTCRFLAREKSGFFGRQNSGILIESYGTDPMVFLPPLAGKPFFPILLEVRLRVLAIG